MRMIHITHEDMDAFIHEHVSLFAPRTRVDIYIYRDNALMYHCIVPKMTEEKLKAFAMQKMKDVSKCQRLMC